MKKETAKERMNDTLLEMVTALYDVDEIDAITIKKYQTLGAPEIKPLSSKEIKCLRIKEKVSQAVFAKLLNISPETVKKWEQGERHPTGASLKLLNLVANNGLNVLCQHAS